MSDRAEIRQFLFPLVDFGGARSLLDLGCGKGGDLLEMGKWLGTDARLVGIDSSQKGVDVARESASGDPRIELVLHDVSQGLPFDDESFDIVYSMNMLECITDKDALLREVHRVLKPGGQVVCAHHDWDSMLIDGGDKDLVRKIVHAFGDWKQAWMADCDSWMGRRLWRVFNRSGLFEGKVHAHALVSTEFEPGCRGYEYIKDFGALARQGMIAQEEYDRLIADVQGLAAKGEYFYSINLFAYAGHKI